MTFDHAFAVVSAVLAVLYLGKLWDANVWRARAEHAELRYLRDVGLPLWVRDCKDHPDGWLLSLNEALAKFRIDNRHLLGRQP